MTVNFASLEKLPDPTSGSQTIKGIVHIRLAGELRTFEVSYQFYKDKQNNVHALGERYLYFSDFNIPPPKKFAGLLAARDRLKVRFHLQLKPAVRIFCKCTFLIVITTTRALFNQEKLQERNITLARILLRK